MLKKALCDLFGVEYSIVQGGIAWLATAELTAAVPEAGGPGVIGTGNAPPESSEQQIVRAREMTTKSFGCNVMFSSPFATDIKVNVVTTGVGNPGIFVPRFKEAGSKVMPVVSSVVLARRLEHVGVDTIVAEGMESGGPIGNTTMALEETGASTEKLNKLGTGSFYAGVVEMGSLMTGQICGLTKDIKSVYQNIHDIIAEANAIMAGLSATPQGVS